MSHHAQFQLGHERETEVAEQLELAAMAHLTAMELSVETRTDFAELRDLLTPVLPGPFNPTFDPACRDLSPESYWLRVATNAGQVIGTIATTTFRGHFAEAIGDGSLWYRSTQLPADWSQMAPVRTISRRIDGHWTHDGAGWVDPAWRDNRIAFHMQSLIRAQFLRQRAANFVTAICFHAIARRSVPAKSYGYPEHGAELVIDGYFPISGRAESMYALHMDKTEALEDAAGRYSSSSFQLPWNILETVIKRRTSPKSSTKGNAIRS